MKYLCVLSLFLIFLAANAQKRLGEWVDLPKTLGWTQFNNKGYTFDATVNMKYCQQHVISIPCDSAKEDYTEEINTAFKTLSARTPPGGTVKLSAGTYPLSGQLVMFSYSCIIGAGMNETVVRLKNKAAKFEKAGVIRSMHSERITVKDLTIDGNRKGQTATNLYYDGYGRYGLFTELTNYLYIKSTRAINNLGYGFDPHGSKEYWAYYLLLEDCEAHYNGLDGFTLDQTVYVTLRNSRAYANDRHGVNIVTGTRNCKVLNCEAKDNGFVSAVGCNMMAQNNQQFRTADIAFEKNTLVNGRKAGFCVNDVTKVTLERNKVSNSFSSSYCYWVQTSNNVILRSGKCNASRGGKNVMRMIKGAQIKMAREAKSSEGATTISTRS